MGNVKKIVARSSWERKFMRYCDHHPNIIAWSSEEVVVPYISPVDKKPHRYFPDFVVKMRTKSGEIKTIMVEVKPLSQTRVLGADHYLVESHGKKRKRKLKEFLTSKVNHAKWAAAEVFCQRNNWEFKIMTERELNIK